MNDESLTVGEVASQLGLTVRALHHWDSIGLVRPSGRSNADYRLYTEDDVNRASRVAIYRELGVGLDEIAKLIDQEGKAGIQRLREQREQLAERIAQLSTLDERLQSMIDIFEHGLTLDANEQREAFGDEWRPEWSVEAQQRYGSSDQWAEFAEKAAGRTTSDWKNINETMSTFSNKLADAMGRGVDPGSDEAHALAEEHRRVFSQFFHITRNMQVCLGRMYVTNPDFAKHYDSRREGLAVWFSDVIDANARSNGIDPETAEWA